MNKNNTVRQSNTSSKLALLRQKREAETQEVDIEKAIEGYVSSIDENAMIAEIARNSAKVNFIIDRSYSMNGTSYEIAQEINGFAKRQATKIYKTLLSLTLFNDLVSTEFRNLNVREFVKLDFEWSCDGGTNIYDAIFDAIDLVNTSKVVHRIYVIITDGENGESSHTQEQVKQLITRRINAGDHIFLLYNDNDSCNSAKEYAEKLGIKPNNAVNFMRGGDGIKIIFQAIEDLLDGLRTNGVIPNDWAKAIVAHAANPTGIKARETKYLE